MPYTGVNKDGYREIIGAAEGMKEDKDSWKNFFVGLVACGNKSINFLKSLPQI